MYISCLELYVSSNLNTAVTTYNLPCTFPNIFASPNLAFALDVSISNCRRHFNPLALLRMGIGYKQRTGSVEHDSYVFSRCWLSHRFGSVRARNLDAGVLDWKVAMLNSELSGSVQHVN